MTDPDRFELYSYWRSSATYRVRVAFNLKGLKPREINVDIDAGEQLGAPYRKLNPMGGIPALIDHAQGRSHAPMTQSLAILEYLDETYPTPALLPADAVGRARVRSICQMLAADTHPLLTPRVRKYLTTAGGFDADAWRALQMSSTVRCGPGRAGAAARDRIGHRRLLPWRRPDDGGHLPGQHHQRDAGIQDRDRGHPDGAAHRGRLRGARGFRRRRSRASGRRAEVSGEPGAFQARRRLGDVSS